VLNASQIRFYLACKKLTLTAFLRCDDQSNRRSASRPSGVNIAAIRTALRRARRSSYMITYDKLTGWSNVIPVVAVKDELSSDSPQALLARFL
jgi:hypothetical protein